MKINISKVIPAFILAFGLVGFSTRHEGFLNQCYISFDAAADLKAMEPEYLSEGAAQPRAVKTKDGEKFISVRESYRVLYNNQFDQCFVNLNVERSEEDSIETDRQNLLRNLEYLISVSKNMMSDKLIELDVNGYKIYGLNRNSLEHGNIIGIFVMFPENGTVIYFFFNNLKAEERHYGNWEEFMQKRDRFLEEYTSYLAICHY